MKTRWTEMHSKYQPYGNRNWKRPGYIGGNKLYSGACDLNFGHRISGSGLGAFGEKKDWSYVDMRVDFPEDKDEVAMKLIYELQVFIDKFLEENGLGIPDGCRDKDYNEV